MHQVAQDWLAGVASLQESTCHCQTKGFRVRISCQLGPREVQCPGCISCLKQTSDVDRDRLGMALDHREGLPARSGCFGMVSRVERTPRLGGKRFGDGLPQLWLIAR